MQDGQDLGQRAATQARAAGPDDTLFPDQIVVSHVSRRRRISERHVRALMDSIGEVGLVHPVVIDARGSLLAGAHRLRALILLRCEKPGVFHRHYPDGKIPVRRLAISGAEQALAVEIAENEKRRDLTKLEMKQVIERLRDAGYSTKKGGKKQARDKEHLTEALARVMGKSRRTARRLYEQMLQGEAPADKNDYRRDVRHGCQNAIQRCLRAGGDLDVGLRDALQRSLQLLRASMTATAVPDASPRLAGRPGECGPCSDG